MRWGSASMAVSHWKVAVPMIGISASSVAANATSASGKAYCLGPARLLNIYMPSTSLLAKFSGIASRNQGPQPFRSIRPKPAPALSHNGAAHLRRGAKLNGPQLSQHRV